MPLLRRATLAGLLTLSACASTPQPVAPSPALEAAVPAPAPPVDWVRVEGRE